ncbi:MAG TPA: peptidylprolyl isomerase, partial [Acidimicrobiales bacterium]|nr:peptidylprolyl isomerase [Acidimicrobiales bacterium]
MSKVRQREKQKARRVRRQHGLREEATAASRPRRRLVRAGVGMVAALGILFLGVLGSVIRQDASQDPRTTTTVARNAEGAVAPPCPAPDGSSPRRTLFDAAPAMCIDPNARYQARFVTTAGAFVADLDPERSPLAVNNFVFLARYHFYDDLPFHRVIRGFYAQTGDPVDPDQVGPGYTFDDDPLPPVGTYKVGSLVFAHEEADENGSQFLIWLGPEVSRLPHVYPLFGQVSSGRGTLERIDADGGTADDPTPDTPHRIER